jgi:hypothetical protein
MWLVPALKLIYQYPSDARLTFNWTWQLEPGEQPVAVPFAETVRESQLLICIPWRIAVEDVVANRKQVCTAGTG